MLSAMSCAPAQVCSSVNSSENPGPTDEETELRSLARQTASSYISEHMNLLDLLKRAEGKTLEFKRDLTAPEGALKTLVAFANASGGTLLIGVEDRTRHVRGVSDPLDLEERLANLISDDIVPRLVPELEILPWRRTHVLAVQVHPSASRPTTSSGWGSRVVSTCEWVPPTGVPTAISSMSCAASPVARRTTNSRCQGWTRKRSTSERLPSSTTGSRSRIRASALRPHGGRSSPWHLEAAQSCGWSRLPPARPDRAVGQLDSAHDGGHRRCRATAAGTRGDWHAVPGDAIDRAGQPARPGPWLTRQFSMSCMAARAA